MSPNRKKECPYCGYESMTCTRTARDISENSLIAETKRFYYCNQCESNILVETPRGKFRKIKLPKKYIN